MISEDKKIKTKAQLREYLDAECGGYKLSGRRWIAYLLQISERAILTKHMRLLRTTEYYVNTNNKIMSLIYRARLMKFQNKHCIHIPLNSCGKGLKIQHVIPVAMNGNVTLGENCRIMPLVMLAGDDVTDACPTIGNNVTLGIGSSVFGNVTLADDIFVGAGAVVNKSFLEPGIAIAGVPAKKVGVSPFCRAPEESES